MNKIIQGKVLKYGDNINTDIISPPQYLELSLAEAAKYAMSNIDPDFGVKVQKGDIMVAGINFGSGSSRETSPLTLKYLGIEAVIAKSFARIFYRNAINIGLPVIETDEVDKIDNGDIIEINLEAGFIRNTTKNQNYKSSKIPAHILKLIYEGGLVAHLKNNL